MLNRRCHARIGLAIVGMFWSASLMAMPSQIPPSSSGTDEAEHEALRKLKAVYEDAVGNNHIDALSGSFHSDFHGVMVTGRAVNSFADVQQFWRDIRGLIGEGGSYTTTVNPERSVILGDVALARGTTDDVVKTSDGHDTLHDTLDRDVTEGRRGLENPVGSGNDGSDSEPVRPRIREAPAGTRLVGCGRRQPRDRRAHRRGVAATTHPQKELGFFSGR